MAAEYNYLLVLDLIHKIQFLGYASIFLYDPEGSPVYLQSICVQSFVGTSEGKRLHIKFYPQSIEQYDLQVKEKWR